MCGSLSGAGPSAVAAPRVTGGVLRRQRLEDRHTSATVHSQFGGPPSPCRWRAKMTAKTKSTAVATRIKRLMSMQDLYAAALPSLGRSRTSLDRAGAPRTTSDLLELVLEHEDALVGGNRLVVGDRIWLALPYRLS